MWKNIKKINDALLALEEEGTKSFKPECINNFNRWQKIGQAIAAVDNSKKAPLWMAYEILEDKNWHWACRILSYAFRDVFVEYSLFADDLKALAFLSAKDIEYKKFEEDGRLSIHHASVKVTVEYLD